MHSDCAWKSIYPLNWFAHLLWSVNPVDEKRICELLKFMEHAFRPERERNRKNKISLMFCNNRKGNRFSNWMEWSTTALLIQLIKKIHVSLAFNRLFFHRMNGKADTIWMWIFAILEAILDWNLERNVQFSFCWMREHALAMWNIEKLIKTHPSARLMSISNSMHHFKHDWITKIYYYYISSEIS